VSCSFPNSITTTCCGLVVNKLATSPSSGKLRGNVCNGFWASTRTEQLHGSLGTLPGVTKSERVLIMARVDVTEKDLESQLAGGPVLFAQSPVTSGRTVELLVMVRRLISDIAFTIDFGDGRSQPVIVDVFQVYDLPDWLRAGTFSSPQPFLLTGRGVTFYGRIGTLLDFSLIS